MTNIIRGLKSEEESIGASFRGGLEGGGQA
jgi:hypothetical protein